MDTQSFSRAVSWISTKSAFELFLPTLLDCQALTALLTVIKIINSGLPPPLSLTQIHFNMHTHKIWWSCLWSCNTQELVTVQVFLHSYLTELQVHTDLPTCQDTKAATSNVEIKSTQRELFYLRSEELRNKLHKTSRKSKTGKWKPNHNITLLRKEQFLLPTYYGTQNCKS